MKKKQGKSALSIVQKYHPQVKKVVDAKHNVEINVTQHDCRGGDPHAPDTCAMARAFKREYDGAVISMSVAYLIEGDQAIRFTVPPSVAREIVSFDRNHNFSPGEYYLKAPNKSEKLSPRKYALRKERHEKQYARQSKRRHHKTAGIRKLGTAG